MGQESYFDFAKRKRIAVNLYHYYLFSAITNKIDLKKGISQIKQDLNTMFSRRQQKKINSEHSPELQTLIDLIKTTQNNNTYVQYSVYIESCAKRLGWHEVLDCTLYELLELIEAKKGSQIKIVKTISNSFSKVELSPNDLLLSGILDIEALDTSGFPIKKALQEMRLWNNVKETLSPKLLPTGIKKFIINQVSAGNISIPDDGDSLFIHIEENLKLIKEIFNENLGSEDNDRNEEKDIYNDEGEEEYEEISSRMFAFIPTYNTPRSSINNY
ncbi:21872_t:CDS:2 [Dentiscutata erythropus]|uniref:21872_t:CDS:1 n=1 Tax=Dentiscutata erythropus TaxID=1348616 RepID=A0A9N9EF69_9GLOM|nr:21872_t:CDS:2 [Dentiscutata erythropus]